MALMLLAHIVQGIRLQSEFAGLTTPPRTKLDRARRVRVVEVAGSRLWGLLGVFSKSLPMLSEPGPVALQPLT